VEKNFLIYKGNYKRRD